MKIRKTIIVDSEKWKQFRSKLIMENKTINEKINELIDNYNKVNK